MPFFSKPDIRALSYMLQIPVGSQKFPVGMMNPPVGTAQHSCVQNTKRCDHNHCK